MEQVRVVDNGVLTGRRVLVVEDETVVCMMIEDMLAELGCLIVGSAADFDRALALADEAAADIAILDVNLNGVRSVPVADKLAARGLPFVFATGYGVSGVGDGHRHVPTLKKPFSQSELAEALSTALRETGSSRG